MIDRLGMRFYTFLKQFHIKPFRNGSYISNMILFFDRGVLHIINFTKISTILNHFDEKDGQEVCIAGRIIAIRSFGKIAFVKIRDYFGEIQIFMQKAENLQEGELGIKELKLLDTGDFIEAVGKVGKSSTGEISVFADSVRLLTKHYLMLLPVPISSLETGPG